MAIGLDKIHARTAEELGTVKSDAQPVDDEGKQLPASQYNQLADAVIALETAVGLKGSEDPDSLVRAIANAGGVTNPLSEDLDADGHDVVGLPSYDPAVDPPPSDMSAAVSASTMNNAFNFLLPQWASHEASEDVDLDGNKAVNAADPEDPQDLATKAYVDSQAGVPTKIENGTSKVEVVSSGGNIEIRRSNVLVMSFPASTSSEGFLVSTPEVSGQTTHIRQGFNEIALEARLYGALQGVLGIERTLGAPFGKPFLVTGGGTRQYLVSAGFAALPSGVASYMQGIHLAKEAHDQRALAEWWEPTWTPVSNVDSVANVECQYTRVRRAAGGSLVTLEGTITVEIDEDDASTILSAPLPVPATSTGTLLAPATGVDLLRGDRAVCGAVVTDLGSGPVLVIDAGALANATGVPATLTIGFSISYRAA